MIQALEKPKRKRKKASIQKRCDTLASAYYRRLTPYCQAAGKVNMKCGGPIQWCHILGRGNLRIRYEPYNHLILCAGAHVWFTHHPQEWFEFVQEHYPDKWALAQAHKDEVLKPFPYVDWIEIFSQGLEY